MSAHHKGGLTRVGAGLTVLAALLVASCGGGMSQGDGSASASGAPSSTAPPGAPANGDGGNPQTPPGGPGSPSDNPRPPGEGTGAPPASTDTSGWERDRNGNLIGPPGW